MLTLLTSFLAVTLAVNKTTVEIMNRTMYVNGEVFNIQGMCYSPVPIRESPSYPPMGDYFTEDYAYIWRRDIPLLKAMGVNTVRIYGWAQRSDHTAFLDELALHGMYAMLTYFVPNGVDFDYTDPAVREVVVSNFTTQVLRYGSHDAILSWSFGNELNGPWNKLMDAFNKIGKCGWTQGTCWQIRNPTPTCKAASRCLFSGLLGMINDACGNATAVLKRPCTSALADVDFLVDPDPQYSRVSWYSDLVPNVGFWAMQLYRGYSFGTYFSDYEKSTTKYPKPMVVTEFGVDAYNDPCGWTETRTSYCTNIPDDPKDHRGGVKNTTNFTACKETNLKLINCTLPGETAQERYDVNCAQELIANYPNNHTKKGSVLGGFLMAWVDEFWKGFATQDMCYCKPCDPRDIDKCNPADYPGKACCTGKPHWTCPNGDASWHGLCGYWLPGSTPDGYVNEEWFGVTEPITCNFSDMYGGHNADVLSIRPVYYAMQHLWTGARTPQFTLTCHELGVCYDCIAAHPDSENVLHTVCSTACGVVSAPTSSPTSPTGPTAPTSVPTGPSAVPTLAPTPGKPVNDWDIQAKVVMMANIKVVEPAKREFFSQLALALDLPANRIDDSDSYPITPTGGKYDDTYVGFAFLAAQWDGEVTATRAFNNLKWQMDNVTAGKTNQKIMSYSWTKLLCTACGVENVSGQVPTPYPTAYPTEKQPTASPTVAPTQPGEQAGSTNVAMYVGVAIAVLVVIGVAGWCLMKRNSRKSQTSINAPLLGYD